MFSIRKKHEAIKSPNHFLRFLLVTPHEIPACKLCKLNPLEMKRLRTRYNSPNIPDIGALSRTCHRNSNFYWFGGQRYRGMLVQRYLYDQLIDKLPDTWKLKPKKLPHNPRSVNPWAFTLENGYNALQDLPEAIDELAELAETISDEFPDVNAPITLASVEERLQHLYTVAEIEKAFKLLNRSFKC